MSYHCFCNGLSFWWIDWKKSDQEKDLTLHKSRHSSFQYSAPLEFFSKLFGFLNKANEMLKLPNNFYRLPQYILFLRKLLIEFLIFWGVIYYIFYFVVLHSQIICNKPCIWLNNILKYHLNFNSTDMKA